MTVAFGLRIYSVRDLAFNDDEFWHLTVAGQETLWEVILANFREEVHPPLSYIILHYMMQISSNDLWLRMSSIIPGVLLIPAMYVFGRLYIGKAAAYFLAFLFAFGAMPLSISIPLRPYPLMMLALTLAAIFVENFRRTQNRKYLAYYFIAMMTAIELIHSAALAVFSFGLILLYRAFKEKKYHDFTIIAVMHGFLAFLVIGYAVLLKHFGFDGRIPGYFSPYSWMYYFNNYLQLVFWFPLGSTAKDFFAGIFSLFAIISLFATPIALFRSRNWLLLQMIFLPLILIIVTDYLRIFPFSPVPRNNLFLLFSLAILYAFCAQVIANKLIKFCEKHRFNNKEKLVVIINSVVLASVTAFLVCYVISNNFFYKTWPSCAEASISKSDYVVSDEVMQRKNVASNVFVTAAKNVWRFRAQSKKDGELTLITKHLVRFKNDDLEIYFSAFPARDFSTNIDFLEYKLFFSDLFKHLEEQKKLSQIKSFTYFDVGMRNDFLAIKFMPEFIPYDMTPFPSAEDKMHYRVWQEGYNFGWAVHSSPQVLEKFYRKDSSFSCGREILFLSFTPKFVRDQFLNKDFVNGRAFDRKLRGL